LEELAVLRRVQIGRGIYPGAARGAATQGEDSRRGFALLELAGSFFLCGFFEHTVSFGLRLSRRKATGTA
jgi:hypothetical protein